MTLSPEFLNQIPAIVIIFPLFFSCFIVISSNTAFARAAFTGVNIALFIISFLGLIFSKFPKSYYFGGWEKPVGIEFKYDELSAFGVCLLYFISSLFAVFYGKYLSNTLEKRVIYQRRHIPYALLLLVEVGYSGLILTNDIFNLFVCLEIASLSTYPLLAIGKKRAPVNAFEYLIIGTLAATAVLVSIGFILALTGTLNIDYIKADLKISNVSISIISSFLICGILTKLAAFPLYDWKVRSYSSTSNVISSFFLCTSPLCFIIVFIKLSFLLELMPHEISYVMKILGLSSIVFGAYFAFKEVNFIRIIILSSLSSIGYLLILWPFNSSEIIFVILQFMMIDSLTKLALMLIPPSLGVHDFNLKFIRSLASGHKFTAVIFAIILLNAAAIPPSFYFFNKIQIMELRIANSFWLIIPISLSSLFLAMAYIRVARQMIKNFDEIVYFNVDRQGLSAIAFCAIILVAGFFMSDFITHLATQIYHGIN